MFATFSLSSALITLASLQSFGYRKGCRLIFAVSTLKSLAIHFAFTDTFVPFCL